MSQNKYISVPIKGMHCRSCELLLEDKFKDLDQVKSVDISYKTGEAVIYYVGNPPSNQTLNKIVTEAGYAIGTENKAPFLNNDKKEYANLGFAFLFLLALYLIFRGLGLSNFNLIPDLSSPSWGLIILVGLVAGFSTCMALVGGLSLGLSTKYIASHPQATPTEKFRPHIFFVLGRILSYTFLGGILGMIGAVFQLSTTANVVITILVALVMLVMGLQLTNIFPRLSNFKLTLPKGLSRSLGFKQNKKEYSHGQAMILGAFTFFLPCGFTQAMQLYAISTGNFIFGALVMGLFALGTAPGLLSIGGVTSLVRGTFKERFFKVAGLAVIFFAIFNLSNAYTLAGGNFFSASENNKQNNVISDPNVTLENGVQVVRMTENNNGYTPNKFSIKKGVPVKWIIDAQAPYSCASVILLPKLKIQKFLAAGENIVEFTPTESGTLPFSCSMGMYKGVFNVYEDEASVSVGSAVSGLTNTALAASNNSSGTSGGTCGASGGGCGCGGGRAAANINAKPVVVSSSQGSATQGSVQIIKTTYTSAKYLDPAVFKVKAGTKVRLEINVRDSGTGCGYALTIPGLYSGITPLEAGVPILIEFTPSTPGTYDITCSMNMIRFGSIIVE